LVLAHVGFMTGFELSQLSFLVGGQDLHDLRLDAGV
jgi:hypothetical protein